MGSYVIVLRISNLPLSRNGLLEFGIVPTVWYLLFVFYFITVRRGFRPIKLALTPPLLIEVSTPSQESERLCICVLGVSIFPLSLRFF